MRTRISIRSLSSLLRPPVPKASKNEAVEEIQKIGNRPGYRTAVVSKTAFDLPESRGGLPPRGANTKYELRDRKVGCICREMMDITEELGFNTREQRS